MRRGTVKPRSQLKDDANAGTWTKRDSGITYPPEMLPKADGPASVIVGTVTRIEVIDETGRVYVKYGAAVELSYQDDGRTLKVFVRSRGAEAEDKVRKQIGEGLQQFIKATRPAEK